jgi:DNA-binding transcriptional LysR family regulator
MPDTQEVPLTALLEHPVITYARTTRPYAELRQKFSDLNGPLPRIFPVSTLAASLRMALDGVGIAVLPHTMVREHLATGQLAPGQLRMDPAGAGLHRILTAEPMNALAHRAADTGARCGTLSGRGGLKEVSGSRDLLRKRSQMGRNINGRTPAPTSARARQSPNDN